MKPQFTQTFWFPAALVAVGALIVSLLTAWRLSWLRRFLGAQQAAALDRERARIARDLHDDLGTSITGIALQTDVALRDMQNKQALGQRLQAVARDARSVVDQLREVVWATNPQCDTVESFAIYAGQFAENFLAAAGLRCRLDYPEAFPLLELRSEVRHALFLVVKEALHNVVRHAGATEVCLRVRMRGRVMDIVIGDNGRGAVLPERAEQGNGLANMRQRIEALGGRFEWRRPVGEGATVRLEIDLDGGLRPHRS